MKEKEIREILNKKSFPHKIKYLKLKETYISWLIFTGDFVYKIKKPVKFGYLDFSSIKKRRFFCEKELILNKRLASEIYLGVVPIVKEDGFFKILSTLKTSSKKTVDYALKMREIPEEYYLPNLLKNKKFDSEKIKEIAKVVASFHQRADISPKKYGFKIVKFNWKENFEQTEPFLKRVLQKPLFDFIKKEVERYLRENRELFLKRIKEGKIRDGHGDLHSGNIFVTPKKVYIIDCIEFNERFRHQDIASDIAFFLMDLEYLRKENLAKEFLKEYLSISKDETLLWILPFYKCYRAFIRAKVGCFSLPRVNLLSIQRYFGLAFNYALRFSQKKPFLIVIGGQIGTGKSYLAKSLKRIILAKVLNSDVIRKKMFGIPLFSHKKEVKKIYTQKVSIKVYQKMIERGITLIKKGKLVILDATFARKIYHQMLIEKVKKEKIPFLFVECWASPEKILKRLKERGKKKEVSDATPLIYLKLKDRYERINLPTKNYLFLNREKENISSEIEKTLKKILRFY